MVYQRSSRHKAFIADFLLCFLMHMYPMMNLGKRLRPGVGLASSLSAEYGLNVHVCLGSVGWSEICFAPVTAFVSFPPLYPIEWNQDCILVLMRYFLILMLIIITRRAVLRSALWGWPAKSKKRKEMDPFLCRRLSGLYEPTGFLGEMSLEFKDWKISIYKSIFTIY